MTTPTDLRYENTLLQIRINALAADRDALIKRIESHRQHIAKLTAETQRLKAALRAHGGVKP